MSFAITESDWKAAGRERYGDDLSSWKFRCPSCGYVATPADWRAAGAPPTATAFSCVGRWMAGRPKEAFGHDGGPCNYAGGGLFRLNPVRVVLADDEGESNVFDFADRPLLSGAADA